MIVRVSVLAGWLVIVSSPAWAQGPSPAPLPGQQQMDYQQQRILDLKDYREWLEGQVALAKSLLNEARQILAQKEAELAACRATPHP